MHTSLQWAPWDLSTVQQVVQCAQSIMWTVQIQPHMVARCQAGVSTAFMGVGMDSLGICLLCGLTNVWCIHSLLCEILTSVWCMVSGWTHALTWINWFLVTGVTNVLYMDSILCGVLTDKWWDLPKAKGCIWPHTPCLFLGLKGPPADYHLCDRGCQALHIVLLY